MLKKITHQIRKQTISVAGISILSLLLLLAISCKKDSTVVVPTSSVIQFVYSSDAHFGITRATFQGATNVNSTVVNAKLVEKINSLPTLTIPADNGVNAGKVVGGIDYFINTGDFSNREESASSIQSATVSWGQFTSTYINGLTLKNSSNTKTPVLIVAGNHDVSNAVGYYKAMLPLTDNGSMVGTYNYMFPSTPKTTTTYDYATNKIHYSKDISGVHLVFVNMWPDETERTWMTTDLNGVSTSTPVILFAHDQPNVETKHFTNPNGTGTINSTDKFENLIPEVFKDGAKTIADPSTLEQRSFVTYLKAHTNIKAYFHGNDNENKFYDYKGPDSDITLKTFQVDSPMKGNISGTDETKLSFQLISIDTKAKMMTVRECLWNSVPTNPSGPIVWGATTTISL
jgi:hypothetical protein